MLPVEMFVGAFSSDKAFDIVVNLSLVKVLVKRLLGWFSEAIFSVLFTVVLGYL